MGEPLTSLRAASRCFHSLSSMACSSSSRPSCLLSCFSSSCIFSLWERRGGKGKGFARGEVEGIHLGRRGKAAPRYLHLLQLHQVLGLLLLQLLQLLRLLLLLPPHLRLLPPLLLLQELRGDSPRHAARPQPSPGFAPPGVPGSPHLLGQLSLLSPVDLLALQVALEEGQACFGVAALAFQHLGPLLGLLAPQLLQRELVEALHPLRVLHEDGAAR